MNAGGLVMWVLFVLNFALWYGLGYRYLILKRGTKGNVRRFVDKHEKRGENTSDERFAWIMLRQMHLKQQKRLKVGVNVRKHIDGCASSLYSDSEPISVYWSRRSLFWHHLLGYLGTVIGMIETFDALQNSSMFSQGASISGGISKALFTTELGLVVAVPGLIVGRILDKQAERYELEFEQITDIISTKDE